MPLPSRRIKLTVQPGRKVGVGRGKSSHKALLLAHTKPLNAGAQFPSVEDTPRANLTVRGLVNEDAGVPTHQTIRVVFR